MHAPLGSDHDHQRVGQPDPASVSNKQPLLIQLVHFGFISGEEDVCGRAFLDLTSQCAGRAEIDNDLVGRFLFVFGGDGSDRLGETRGGKDDDFACAEREGRETQDNGR